MNRYANILPFNANETLASYFSRLAAAFEYDSAREFGKDAGVNFDRLVFGDPQTLEDFGDFLDWKPTLLERGAVFKDRTTSNVVIAGQSFLPSQITHSPVRICPHCVLADEHVRDGRRGHRAFGRSAWLVEAIRVCAVHGSRLVELTAPGSGPSPLQYDFAAWLRQAYSVMPELLNKSCPAEQSALDRFVTTSISEKRPSIDWLDGIPLYAIIRVAIFSGVVSYRGPNTLLEDLNDEELSVAAGHGFEAMAAGKTHYTRYVKQIARRSAGSARIVTGKSIFGALYVGLARSSRDRAYDPFREVLRTVAIEELPVGPRDSIFGKVEQRKIHSVYTASREFGVDDRLLKKLVSQNILFNQDVSSSTSNRICADAQSMQQLAAELAESIELPKARAYIGANRMQFEAILRSKCLAALAGVHPGGRTGRSLPIKRRFRVADLDGFLSRLSGVAIHQPGSRLLDLETACRKAGCSFSEALALVLEDRLENVATDGRVGISGLLLDPSELKEKTGGTGHGCLTLRQVVQTLPVKHETLRVLIDTGMLQSVRHRNPTKRFLQTLVEPAEIDRFKQEFVGAWEIARRMKIAIKDVRSHLDPIQPAFDPRVVFALFFRRAEISLD